MCHLLTNLSIKLSFFLLLIESASATKPVVKRRLKSSKERQRAKKPLPPKLKYDYPIVRHHPLFAKQSKPGEKSNNFSSLLMGKNVRIIRGQSLSSNDSVDDRFEIFNPELDDSDSDNDGRSISSDEHSESDSSSCDSNDSVESVVSASRASVSLKEEVSPSAPSLKDEEIASQKPPEETGDALEISKRAEKRRQSLMSLLDENQSVISTIMTEKRRQLSISASSSAGSLKQSSAAGSIKDENLLLAAHR